MPVRYLPVCWSAIEIMSKNIVTSVLFEGKIHIVVRSHSAHLDLDYASWIQNIKKRFRNARIKAAVKDGINLMQNYRTKLI